MTDETTTEQLAEIEGQAEPVQVREGRWRTRHGDIRNVTPTPAYDSRAKRWPWRDAKYDQTWREDGGCHIIGESPSDLVEYLGPIEPQPQPKPEPQPEPETMTEQLADTSGRDLVRGMVLQVADLMEREEAEIGPQPQPVQVREGRWRTEAGEIVSVSAMPTDHDDFSPHYPWWDGDVTTWADNGIFLNGQTAGKDLVEYLGPLEQQPQPVPQHNGLVRDVTHLLQESGVLESAKAEQQIEELRSEVSYVQNLLGTERRRVTQLEELVGSLRTINEAQEKAVRLAGQANTDLQHRLDVVSAEWAEQSETVRKLRIELDAAQQVPQAVSDRFEEGWDAGTARAVETIAEWTEPLRACGSQRLAWMVMANLPHIMRHLTGLADED